MDAPAPGAADPNAGHAWLVQLTSLPQLDLPVNTEPGSVGISVAAAQLAAGSPCAQAF